MIIRRFFLSFFLVLTTLSIDAQIQANAYQRIRDAVAAHKAKAGSVVVLDSVTGEPKSTDRVSSKGFVSSLA